MTMYDKEDSSRCNRGLKAVIVPGSNEGCYIDIMIGDICIQSNRFAYYDASDKEIKKLCRECNRLISLGIFPAPKEVTA